MRQRNAGIGGTAIGRGNARHHLERNTGRSQFRDFLAATAEHEGITALEAQHALAFSRQAHQRTVDVLLRQRVLVALLAHVQTFRIAPHQFHDGRRYQCIVQHDVALLHQAHRAQRQQIGIAGTGTDEVDLAVARCVRQQLLQGRIGRGLIAGQHCFGGGAIKEGFPDPSAHRLRHTFADRGAAFADIGQQPPIARRQHGFQTFAPAPYQYRRCAGRGQRDQQRAAVHDRRCDPAAGLRIVHCIDPDATRLGFGRNAPVQCRVVGRGDRHTTAIQLQGIECLGDPQRCQFVQHRLRDQTDIRTGATQQPDLAQGHLTAAHDQNGLA